MINLILKGVRSSKTAEMVTCSAWMEDQREELGLLKWFKVSEVGGSYSKASITSSFKHIQDQDWLCDLCSAAETAQE